MEKITLNEYLKQGSVVENLKNFVGVTPENTMGLMTPERLAAVAGGLRYKGMIKESDDLNNINVSCNYFVNGVVPKNYPNGAYNYGAVITEVISSITVQIVFTHSHSDSYLRVKYNSAENEWNEWRKITSVKVS